MNIAILGLSITSSWGNGHASTYRALLRELHRRGHQLLFLERDCRWYAEHRDLPVADYCDVQLYRSLRDLHTRFAAPLAEADAVIVGSFVPEGIAVIDWAAQIATGVTAFYDIDTPVTLAALAEGTCEYLQPEQVAGFDLYLSFTGGPTLRHIERRYHAAHAAPLYCSVDPARYRPRRARTRWNLGYLGTFSADRQPLLDRLLLEVARAKPELSAVVAGSLYPPAIAWPGNVERIEHLPPDEHATFYNAQRITLNLTRAAMVRAGWSPSVRLFEAAACGTPMISDPWPGLDSFFEPGREILIAESSEDVQRYLHDLSDAQRKRIGERARQRILREHTAAHRAEELESLLLGARAEVRKAVAA